MFGKPDWFRKKRWGWGLQPVCWQGWLYTAAWISVMLLPFWLMMTRRQVPEALIWLAIAIAALVWDVWLIMRHMEDRTRQTASEVLVIDEDGSRSEPVATRHFDLRLRG